MLTLILLLAFLLPAFEPGPLWAGQSPPPARALTVGFSARVFPDVDQRDARIAMEMWTKELARVMGVGFLSQTRIFTNTSELLDAVKRGELSFVTLSAVEYVNVRDRAPMTPVIVNAVNAGKGRQYVLVVRKDSGIRSMPELGNRSIALLSSSRHELSHTWLDVQLMKTGNPGHASFFRQVKEVSSASQAIMGVFFKQSDAALVSRSSLETSRTLNPQIGQQLTVIAESKGLLGDICCIPDMVDEKLKTVMKNATLHLHETAVGRQIFTLFQTDQIIAFHPSYLEGTVELLRERDQLMAKRKRSQ
jgi:ABC-type phosphate/phosphonate transport system substrate-binding protein